MGTAEGLGLDPVLYLNKNNSFIFLKSLMLLLKTGPTDTNVNDIFFMFAFVRIEKELLECERKSANPIYWELIYQFNIGIGVIKPLSQ